MVRSLFLCLLAVVSAAAGDVQPLQQAHAHNDYEHERPLLDALDHGFCGVEADIYLVDGKLLVAHDRKDLRLERTLQALYLDPLRERVVANGGHVFPKKTRFTLLIDIKSDANSTYKALAEVLTGYREILSDGEKERAVSVVISGNRAKDLIAASDPRYAGIDGRLDDLDSKLDKSLLPLISDRWGSHFKWDGEGEMPAAERAKLWSHRRESARRRPAGAFLGHAGKSLSVARIASRRRRPNQHG